MINIASGVKIPHPELIEEKYICGNNFIRLNISFEKLLPLIKEFLALLPEPIFLFIHLPLKKQEEDKLHKPGEFKLHSEILYLDGQTKKQIAEILDQHCNILLNDGLSQFGISSHKTGDEIFIQKYKIVSILSKNINSFIPLIENHDVVKTTTLVTAWDTFTQEAPGISTSVIIDGKDIYYVIEELKKLGMYSAKIVED